MRLTVKLFEDPLDGAGAAATGHGDVEVVSVVRHVACAIGNVSEEGRGLRVVAWILCVMCLLGVYVKEYRETLFEGDCASYRTRV